RVGAAGRDRRVGGRRPARLRRTVVAVNRRLLAIYLNDHMAAATAAVGLAHRAAHSNRGTPYGEVLAGLAAEIEEDRQTLKLIKRARSQRRRLERQRLDAAADALGS